MATQRRFVDVLAVVVVTAVVEPSSAELNWVESGRVESRAANYLQQVTKLSFEMAAAETPASAFNDYDFCAWCVFQVASEASNSNSNNNSISGEKCH